MNSIRKISNATDAPAGPRRSSFFWHWCFPAFGDEQRRRYTCRCVKKASRYRKAQISARHRCTATTQEEPSGAFVRQRSGRAPLLLLRLISQINISFTALGLYFDELEQTHFFPPLLNLESDPTVAFLTLLVTSVCLWVGASCLQGELIFHLAAVTVAAWPLPCQRDFWAAGNRRSCCPVVIVTLHADYFPVPGTGKCSPSFKLLH